MKKEKLLLIACVAMVIACIFVVSIFAVGNETSTPSLTIVSNTLELKNAVFMNFKVSAENVDDTSSVKLLVWESAPSEYTKDSAQLTLSSIRTESDTGYIVFQYDDLAAKDMTKFIYVCAYIENDGIDVYSKPVKFSILQYAQTILDSISSDEKLKELVSNMLYYGATAQTYFEHNTDFLATDSVAKIKVVNGTHADGFKTGYYKAGTSVTLTANAAEEGYTFSYWEDSKGNIVGTESTLIISECVSETYTAVYDSDSSNGFHYRYRIKQYENSTIVLGEPYILYNTITEDIHTGTDYVYLSQNEEIDSAKYCVHDKIRVNKYVNPDGDSWFYATDAEYIDRLAINASLGSYIPYSGYYKYVCCTSVKSSTTYQYYWWSEWSEWSKTPITATEDTEVETAKIYYISFDANGGANAPEIQMKIHNIDLTLSSNIPTRLGYEFIGWSTSSDGTASYKAGDTYSTNENIKLYAIWVASNVIDYGTCGENLKWTVSEDGVLIISGAGAMDNYSYDNNAPWHKYYDFIEYVVIQDGVNNIGDEAFYECSSIVSINIPCSVTSIGLGSFMGCSSLLNIDIPDGVISVGEYAFKNCSALTQVKISNNVTSIEWATFQYCSSLKDITIPNSVIQIEGCAFSNCTSLVNINIPSNVTYIGTKAFYECFSLTNVSISSSVAKIASYAFCECRSLSNIIIPSSVKTIECNAFDNCISLTQIIICKGVTRIDEWAFDRIGTNTIFYEGGPLDWSSISKGSYAFNNITVYYYSAEEPSYDENNYWYFDKNGNPTIWEN